MVLDVLAGRSQSAFEVDDEKRRRSDDVVTLSGFLFSLYQNLQTTFPSVASHRSGCRDHRVDTTEPPPCAFISGV